MVEIDYGQLAKMAANPNTSKTVESIGGLIDKTKGAVNAGHDIVDLVNSGTNLIEAVVKALDRVSALRGIGQAQGNTPQIQGVNTWKMNGAQLPETQVVVQEKIVGVKGKSALHDQIFNELNNLTEEQLKTLASAVKSQAEQK